MSRLIREEDVKRNINEWLDSVGGESTICKHWSSYGELMGCIEDAPTVDVFPLKIGDEAWVIRNFNGTKHVKKGKVTAMVYTQKMELCVTVGKLALGKIGEKVFLTKEEAEAEIMKGEKQ